ncbi:MAG TPA: glycosyltransferase family 4 protein [Microthrixaceae bacterium]|nr:glycosyltransferase family 4 protein [Microthrixaceae bacterium]
MVAASGDRPKTPVASPDTIATLAELSRRSGIRRVHMLAWRDLDDVEAGGSEVHAHNIAAIWAQAGIEVTHRTSYAAGHPQRATRSGYRVIRKAGRYMVFPRTVAAEIAGRMGPRDGLIEIWNGVPFMSPLWVRGPHAVWLHHVHGPMWQMSLPPGLAAAGRFVEEKVAPRFYRRSPIVTLSNSSRDELVSEMGFDADHLTVVPPGVDQSYSPAGTKTEAPTVLAVGRLVPVKNFARLIRVMAMVRNSVPDAVLNIVGEGYERDDLETLIDDLDASQYIHLRGRLSDAELLELMRSSWCLASTSIREGWGMTLTEAAACGTPCVATRIAGHLDATVDGEAGLLGTTDAELVDHLVAVLTDAELRERLGRGAIKRAGELTWEAAAIATFEVLAATATPRGPHDLVDTSASTARPNPEDLP